MPPTQRSCRGNPYYFKSLPFFRQDNLSGSMIAFGAVGVLSAGAGIFILGPILYYEWKHLYQNAYPVSVLPEQMPPTQLERVSAEDQSDTPDTPVPQRDAARPQDSLPSVSSSIDSMEARIQNQVSSPPVSRGRVNFPSESPSRSTRIPVPSPPTSDRDQTPMSRPFQRNDLPIYQASVGIHFILVLLLLELDRLLRNYILIPILGRGSRRDTYVGHQLPGSPMGRPISRTPAPHGAPRSSSQRPRTAQIKSEGVRS